MGKTYSTPWLLSIVCIYNEKYFLDGPCHYMRVWIRILNVPGFYERVARPERKSTVQGSGLVRTAGPCAQRVALMPQAIASYS